jgi:hypothetical protein
LIAPYAESGVGLSGFETRMLFFPCPACSFRMQSTPDRVGQKALCPKCYSQVTVPDPDAPAIFGEDTVPTERDPDLKPVSRAARVMAPLATRTVPKNEAGGVVLFQSLDQSFSPSDCMTQLTAAITMRMKPPPEPPAADFKLSTALWIGLTALGVVLWLATVIYQSGPLHWVSAIAVVLLSIGIGWVAYMAGRQNVLTGLVTLLPPVAIFRLFNGDGRDNHRPLRFVLSGLLLLALVYVNPMARAAVRHAFGMDDHKTELARQNVTPSQRLSQLVGRVDRQPLLDELAKLKADTGGAIDADERATLVAELRRIVKLEDRFDVTTAAMQALVVWAGDAAKPDLLAAARSDQSATRQAVLPIVARWKDAETAAAIAPMLCRREERNAATDVLKSIGRPAEPAVIAVLRGPVDQLTGLAAMTLLDAIGGPAAADAMLAYSQSGDDLILRDIARRKGEELKAKTKGP